MSSMARGTSPGCNNLPQTERDPTLRVQSEIDPFLYVSVS